MIINDSHTTFDVRFHTCNTYEHFHTTQGLFYIFYITKTYSIILKTNNLIVYTNTNFN